MIGFGDASIGRLRDNDAESALEFLSGTYVSPILRWGSEDLVHLRTLSISGSTGIGMIGLGSKGITPYMESIWWDFLPLDSE